MYEGFEWLQMVQGILWLVIGFYLRHTELCKKGEQNDRCCERWVCPIDQLIKVVWHPPLEGVHHEVHPFLHHLHLRDHMWWHRICNKWTAGILSLLPTWALLPSSPFQSLLSALAPSCSSLWLLGLASLWRSCSSKSWFCLVRHSRDTTRVCTYLLRAVVCGLSLVLLLVAIEQVSTIQLFVWEVLIWLLLLSRLNFPQTAPTDDAKNRQ